MKIPDTRKPYEVIINGVKKIFAPGTEVSGDVESAFIGEEAFPADPLPVEAPFESGSGGPSYAALIKGTLAAGATSLTLESNKITSKSLLDIYTDTYGVNPTAATVSAGSVTLTFEAQEENIGVKVRVW